MSDLPEPGEAWVLTEPHYRDEHDHVQTIHGPQGAFIVTYISAGQIGYVEAGAGPEPRASWFVRGWWPWHEHMTRVWPPVEGWGALREAGRVPSDLRAQVQ